MSQNETPHGAFTEKSTPASDDRARTDLKAYLDGELPALRRLGVRAHLVRCPECREEVKWLKRLGEDLKDLEAAHPRPELRARILASLPDTPPGAGVRQARPALRHGVPRLAFSGAFALVGLCAVFALSRFVAHLAPHSGAPPVPNPAPLAINRTAPTSDSAVKVPALPDSPSRNASSYSNQAVAHTEPLENYTDSVSREAEKLYRERTDQMQRANPPKSRPQALLANAREPNHGASSSPSETTPMRLALATEDFVRARANLETWAKQVGGSVLPPTPAVHSDAEKQIVVPDAALTNPGIARADDEKNVLTLRVPTEGVKPLLDAFPRLGTVRHLPQRDTTTKNRMALQMMLRAEARREENVGKRSASVTPPATGPLHRPASDALPAPKGRSDMMTLLIQLEKPASR